jgi:tetratricopeptide (TPR) repeat protein
MAIVIEGFTVVVRLECTQGRFSHPTFDLPNSTALFDEHLWRCAFMAEADARSFLDYLGTLGMKVEPGADCEAIVVDEFDGAESAPCGWLRVAKWDRAVVAWRTGTKPETVVAREGWDPQKGSGLKRGSNESIKHLEFLGYQDGVETYLNNNTGQRLYVGRTSSPADAKFEKASHVISANFVNPGQMPLVGNAADAVAGAVSDLEGLLSLDVSKWNVHWFCGKGLMSLGKHSEAFDAFSRAYQLEQGVEAVSRELAGVCLELGKFDEAVVIAERAATIAPDNAETIGNLALAQLLAGKLLEATASSAKALELDPKDRINLRVRRILDEIVAGTRPQPKTLRDLSTAASSPKTPQKPFWKFW